MSAPTSSQATDPVEALRRGRRQLMIAGAIAVVLGFAAIVVPAVASVATAIFIGWILVIAGGFMTADAFSVRDGKRTAVRLLLALLTFAAGLYLVIAPLDGTFTLTVMLVLWFVAVGALDLLLGILIAVELPSSARRSGRRPAGRRSGSSRVPRAV
jgi:uncharacterized membrane protein HdeD (DUF308 family)